MANEKKEAVTALPQEEYNAEIARLTLEAKRLELADLRDRLDERKMRRENVGMLARINGQTIQQLARNRKLTQDRCNHRKGGNGANGVVAGQGDDSQYCVFKHLMANSDMWVRCLRCGKWWVPPIEDDFETDEGYKGAWAEYKKACEFPTRNSTSSSIAYRWGDNGMFYREQTRHTTNT